MIALVSGEKSKYVFFPAAARSILDSAIASVVPTKLSHLQIDLQRYVASLYFRKHAGTAHNECLEQRC
jgi:hypothetical protein